MKEYELLEFWYGEDFEEILNKTKFPTYKQIYFMMDLVSNLKSILTPYGVEFPYYNEEFEIYLLKTKKKFLEAESNHKIGEIIAVLKSASVILNSYIARPSILAYSDVENCLKQLDKYFSIPKRTRCLNHLKALVPNEVWEVENLRKQEITRKRQDIQRKESWINEMVSRKLQFCLMARRHESFHFARNRFRKNFEVSVKFISENQEYLLTQVYREALAWMLFLNDDYVPETSFELATFFDFLTFGEAGILIKIFQDLNREFRSCLYEVEGNVGEFRLDKECLLTPSFISVVCSLSKVVPYVNDFCNELPVLNQSTSENFHDKKVQKIENQMMEWVERSQSRILENVDVGRLPLALKRQLLLEVQDFCLSVFSENLIFEEIVDQTTLISKLFEESFILYHCFDLSDEVLIQSLMTYWNVLLEEMLEDSKRKKKIRERFKG